MKAIELIKKNALIFSAILVLTFITINTGIIYYNNFILKETTKVKIEAERALYLVDQIWNQVVRNVDVGMRGYALTKSESLLGPVRDGNNDKEKIFAELREITNRQRFSHPQAIDSIERTVNKFLKTTSSMVELIRTDKMEEFHRILSTDPGRDAWLIFEKNSRTVNNFEKKLNEEAIVAYEQANTRTLIVQTLLIVLAFPTLLFTIFKIVKDKKARLNLFLKLEKNNREFLFDPGTPIDSINENEVIENSIRNFKTATYFISQVSNSNFAVQWDGLNSSNEALNKKNLAGELLDMRDKMKLIKAEDDIRNWVSEGLAKFSDVIRKNSDNVQLLTFDILVYLTKYLKAQQGGLFVLQENEEGDSHLELMACYAFNRKKHIKKRIEIGQGLVGQVFLEKRTTMLTKVPEGYTEITSGLGESTPTCILLVPMVYNEKVEAVIELAGFKKYEQYEIEFMEKVGEITASTLSTTKNTEKMKLLVEQFKVHTEQLKAQEEELRQNMEEMQATQEALRRQEQEEVH